MLILQIFYKNTETEAEIWYHFIWKCGNIRPLQKKRMSNETVMKQQVKKSSLNIYLAGDRGEWKVTKNCLEFKNISASERIKLFL